MYANKWMHQNSQKSRRHRIQLTSLTLLGKKSHWTTLTPIYFSLNFKDFHRERKSGTWGTKDTLLKSNFWAARDSFQGQQLVSSSFAECQANKSAWWTAYASVAFSKGTLLPGHMCDKLPSKAQIQIECRPLQSTLSSSLLPNPDMLAQCC